MSGMEEGSGTGTAGPLKDPPSAASGPMVGAGGGARFPSGADGALKTELGVVRPDFPPSADCRISVVSKRRALRLIYADR